MRHKQNNGALTLIKSGLSMKTFGLLAITLGAVATIAIAVLTGTIISHAWELDDDVWATVATEAPLSFSSYQDSFSFTGWSFTSSDIYLRDSNIPASAQEPLTLYANGIAVTASASGSGYYQYYGYQWFTDTDWGESGRGNGYLAFQYDIVDGYVCNFRGDASIGAPDIGVYGYMYISLTAPGPTEPPEDPDPNCNCTCYTCMARK